MGPVRALCLRNPEFGRGYWAVRHSSCNLVLRIGVAKADLLAHTLGLCLSFVELGAPAHDLLGREAFDVAVIELPVGAHTPRERGLHGCPRTGRGFENTQRQIEGEDLRLPVLRPTGAVTKREIGEQKARDAHIFDDVLSAAHDYRGNTALLQRSRGEAEGLVADRAIGNKDRGIDSVSHAPGDDLRAIDFERDAMTAIGRGPVEARSRRADAA